MAFLSRACSRWSGPPPNRARCSAPQRRHEALLAPNRRRSDHLVSGAVASHQDAANPNPLGVAAGKNAFNEINVYGTFADWATLAGDHRVRFNIVTFDRR
jgi:hypothetical protein